MGGGQGTTTTTQTNTPFNASQILDVQNKAVELSNNKPFQYYPGQTFAPSNNFQSIAENDAGNLGLNAGTATSSLVPGAQSTAINSNSDLAAGAGVHTAMPWLDNLESLATSNPTASGMSALNPVAKGDYLAGAAPYLSGLFDLTTGTAANDLAATANGAYLGKNPYLADQYGAAADQVTRAFKSATAPQTDSAMEAAGRFNSGALGNARSVNEGNLGNTLQNLAANLYGTAYGNERGLMNSAASALGNLQTNALSQGGNLYTNQVNSLSNAATNLGQLGAVGQNAQTTAGNSALANFVNLLSGRQNAINATPAVSGMSNTDYTNSITAGGQLQQQQQAILSDLMNRFYGEQNAPWQTLQQEGQIVGSAIPGVQTSSTPYYSNPLGQAIGVAGGVAKAAPMLLAKGG